jgi:release factor glutamine methyltransferase
MVYYYKEYAFNTDDPQVYEPKEDSLLLAGNQRIEKGDYVLDMGCGSGIQAIVASRKSQKVLAADINPHAIDTARKNAEANKAKNIEYLITDLFENIKEEEKFDQIIFNPPYLPSEEKDMQALAWAGGINGRETIDRFIKDAPKHLTEKGRIQLLVSSINDVDDVLKALKKKNLEAKIVAREKLWFEELYVILASNKKT